MKSSGTKQGTHAKENKFAQTSRRNHTSRRKTCEIEVFTWASRRKCEHNLVFCLVLGRPRRRWEENIKIDLIEMRRWGGGGQGQDRCCSGSFERGNEPLDLTKCG